jgi:hypothetical protein
VAGGGLQVSPKAAGWRLARISIDGASGGKAVGTSFAPIGHFAAVAAATERTVQTLIDFGFNVAFRHVRRPGE